MNNKVIGLCCCTLAVLLVLFPFIMAAAVTYTSAGATEAFYQIMRKAVWAPWIVAGVSLLVGVQHLLRDPEED